MGDRIRSILQDGDSKSVCEGVVSEVSYHEILLGSKGLIGIWRDGTQVIELLAREPRWLAVVDLEDVVVGRRYKVETKDGKVIVGMLICWYTDAAGGWHGFNLLCHSSKSTAAVKANQVERMYEEVQP